MVNYCAVAIGLEPEKIVLAMISFGLAGLFLFLMARRNLSTKKKVGFIYGHLTSLFFPFALFSTEAACGFLCLPCGDNAVGLAFLALPTTLIASTLAGFVVIPSLFVLSHKKKEMKAGVYTEFVQQQAKSLQVKAPKIYLVNKARPFAFSFRSLRPSIFLSVGLFDILKKKEIEAVLLHELAHIKQRSSAFKVSAALMRLSPFSWLRTFSRDLSIEEREADRAVIEQQKTTRHLASAKQKVGRFR